MSRIILHSAHYQKEEHRFFSEAPCLLGATRTLGRTIGELVALHVAPSRDGVRPEIIVCSTTVSDLVYDRPELNNGFRSAVEEFSGTEVDQIISTYECASWGYTLRYIAHHHRSGPIIIVIMDPNLPYFAFWERDQVWGRSGHGILILKFDLLDDFAEYLHVGHAPIGKGLLEFARATQRQCTDWSSGTIFIPFLAPAMRPVFERLAVNQRLCPNLYDRYGHCFGSDPWVGLIERLNCDRSATGTAVVVGSFALNGYFCLARVAVAATARVSINV